MSGYLWKEGDNGDEFVLCTQKVIIVNSEK